VDEARARRQDTKYYVAGVGMVRDAGPSDFPELVSVKSG
jgi:hypothetical protein